MSDVALDERGLEEALARRPLVRLALGQVHAEVEVHVVVEPGLEGRDDVVEGRGEGVARSSGIGVFSSGGVGRPFRQAWAGGEATRRRGKGITRGLIKAFNCVNCVVFGPANCLITLVQLTLLFTAPCRDFRAVNYLNCSRNGSVESLGYLGNYELDNAANEGN